MTKVVKKAAKKATATNIPSRAAVLRYLDAQHCVLWGRVGDISRPEGQEKAADWLINALNQINEFDG